MKPLLRRVLTIAIGTSLVPDSVDVTDPSTYPALPTPSEPGKVY